MGQFLVFAIYKTHNCTCNYYLKPVPNLVPESYVQINFLAFLIQRKPLAHAMQIKVPSGWTIAFSKRVGTRLISFPQKFYKNRLSHIFLFSVLKALIVQQGYTGNFHFVKIFTKNRMRENNYAHKFISNDKMLFSCFAKGAGEMLCLVVKNSYTCLYFIQHELYLKSLFSICGRKKNWQTWSFYRLHSILKI